MRLMTHFVCDLSVAKMKSFKNVQMLELRFRSEFFFFFPDLRLCFVATNKCVFERNSQI